MIDENKNLFDPKNISELIDILSEYSEEIECYYSKLIIISSNYLKDISTLGKEVDSIKNKE